MQFCSLFSRLYFLLYILAYLIMQVSCTYLTKQALQSCCCCSIFVMNVYKGIENKATKKTRTIIPKESIPFL